MGEKGMESGIAGESAANVAAHSGMGGSPGVTHNPGGGNFDGGSPGTSPGGGGGSPGTSPGGGGGSPGTSPGGGGGGGSGGGHGGGSGIADNQPHKLDPGSA